MVVTDYAGKSVEKVNENPGHCGGGGSWEKLLCVIVVVAVVGVIQIYV